MNRQERHDALFAALEERILLLDGAMGTMIQAYGLGEDDYRGTRFADWTHDLKGNNDLLSITRPDVIREIHAAFLDAGADIIETNTFNSNAPSMADYGMEALVPELNLTAARLARECADSRAVQDGSPRFVAGVLGPTNRTASLSPDVNRPDYRNVTFADLRETYAEAAAGLQVGEQRGQVAGALEYRPGGLPQLHAEFVGHHVRQRGLAQPRGAENQHVVQRLAALFRGGQENRKLFAHGRLADILIERAGPQVRLQLDIVRAVRRRDYAVFSFAHSFTVDFRARRMMSSVSMSGSAAARTIRLASCGL